MKSLIKKILRTLGLLKVIRKVMYRNRYKTLINKFSGQDTFPVSFRGVNAVFGVQDPYSAAFFATYFEKGVYEEEGLAVLLKETASGSIVFDIGANIGYFTCLAAAHCPAGSVHAFEMGKENFLILEKNIALNRQQNVVAVCKAIDENSGTVSIQDSPVGNAVTKILENVPAGDDIIAVPSVSLDDYCRQSGAKPDFIKIDVEGAEMKVLKGMPSILAGHVKLLIEIHDKELKLFHSSKQEVLEFMTNAGFEMTIIGNDVKKNVLVYAWK